jgi:hypothetical protein
MDITLRKSSVLQNSITSLLKEMDLSGKIVISMFEKDPEGILASAKQDFEALIGRRKALLDALYDLRVKTGKMNSISGIDDILAQMARVERDSQLLGQLQKNDTRDDPEIVASRLERMRTKEESSLSRFSGPDDTITMSVFEKEDIKGFQSKMRKLARMRQSLKDALAEMNARNVITLSEETVKTLEKEELI